MLDKTDHSKAQITAVMQDIGRRAKAAARVLATSDADSKQSALTAAADNLRAGVGRLPDEAMRKKIKAHFRSVSV